MRLRILISDQENSVMLTKKKQIKYALKKWKSAQKHFKQFCHSNHAEELHLMRVSLKKIKVLFKIYPHSQRIINDFKPVKKIFRHAALIRNAYINLKHITRYKLTGTDFKNNVRERLEKETQKFVSRQDDYIKILKKARKNMAKNIVRIENKRLEHIYILHIIKLSTFLAKKISQRDLHQCRKKIKVLLYLDSFLNQSFVKKTGLNKLFLDKLQVSIGEWHDAVATHKLFKTKVKVDKEEIKKIENIIQKKLHTIQSLTNYFEKKLIIQ